MRKRIVVANWKMNTDRGSGLGLLSELLNHAVPADVEIMIAPPFPLLGAASNLLLRDGRLKVAAQNCHQEPSGAYTGEVSASMLASFGVSHVIVGHSERRQYFLEDDALISQKMKAVIQAGICAIYCCGETLAQRESNEHCHTVEQQLSVAFKDVNAADLNLVIVAYEPVWAIGTGRTASPAQAQEMHHFIRNVLQSKFGSTAESLPILYGGSVKADNARELFAQSDIDGGLIGGASLKADEFMAICGSF